MRVNAEKVGLRNWALMILLEDPKPAVLFLNFFKLKKIFIQQVLISYLFYTY